MKTPTKFLAKKSTIKKPAPKKGDSGFSVNQALEIASTSVDAMRAYAEYKKEAEATKRAQIDGQKEIFLGEQNLERARMKHGARLVELDNTDKDGLRRHEETMTKLARKDRELGIKETLQDRVLAQLEAKEISAEEAALLLYGAQE